jgi:hypothetical protein
MKKDPVKKVVFTTGKKTEAPTGEYGSLFQQWRLKAQVQ